jgi:hypothetical protein
MLSMHLSYVNMFLSSQFCFIEFEYCFKSIEMFLIYKLSKTGALCILRNDCAPKTLRIDGLFELLSDILEIQME